MELKGVKNMVDINQNNQQPSVDNNGNMTMIDGNGNKATITTTPHSIPYDMQKALLLKAGIPPADERLQNPIETNRLYKRQTLYDTNRQFYESFGRVSMRNPLWEAEQKEKQRQEQEQQDKQNEVPVITGDPERDKAIKEWQQKAAERGKEYEKREEAYKAYTTIRDAPLAHQLIIAQGKAEQERRDRTRRMIGNVIQAGITFAGGAALFGAKIGGAMAAASLFDNTMQQTTGINPHTSQLFNTYMWAKHGWGWRHAAYNQRQEDMKYARNATWTNQGTNGGGGGDDSGGDSGMDINPNGSPLNPSGGGGGGGNNMGGGGSGGELMLRPDISVANYNRYELLKKNYGFTNDEAVGFINVNGNLPDTEFFDNADNFEYKERAPEGLNIAQQLARQRRMDATRYTPEQRAEMEAWRKDRDARLQADIMAWAEAEGFNVGSGGKEVGGGGVSSTATLPLQLEHLASLAEPLNMDSPLIQGTIATIYDSPLLAIQDKNILQSYIELGEYGDALKHYNDKVASTEEGTTAGETSVAPISFTQLRDGVADIKDDMVDLQMKLVKARQLLARGKTSADPTSAMVAEQQFAAKQTEMKLAPVSQLDNIIARLDADIQQAEELTRKSNTQGSIQEQQQLDNIQQLKEELKPIQSLVELQQKQKEREQQLQQQEKKQKEVKQQATKKLVNLQSGINKALLEFQSNTSNPPQTPQQQPQQPTLEQNDKSITKAITPYPTPQKPAITEGFAYLPSFVDYTRGLQPTNNHILIGGTTGAGKSSFLRTLISELQGKGEEVVVFTNNTNDFYKSNGGEGQNEGRNGNVGVYGNLDIVKDEYGTENITYPDIQQNISTIHNEMNRRLATLAKSEGRDNDYIAYNKNKNNKDAQMLPFNIVLDEYQQYKDLPVGKVSEDFFGNPVILIDKDESGSPKHRVKNYIDEIIKQGRKVGMNVIISTQDPTPSAVGGETLKLFETRVALKTGGREHTNDIMLEAPKVKKGQPLPHEFENRKGQALIKVGNKYMHAQIGFTPPPSQQEQDKLLQQQEQTLKVMDATIEVVEALEPVINAYQSIIDETDKATSAFDKNTQEISKEVREIFGKEIEKQRRDLEQQIIQRRGLIKGKQSNLFDDYIQKNGGDPTALIPQEKVESIKGGLFGATGEGNGDEKKSREDTQKP